ncbi:MAG TPA: 30S ribosome-binding factor RbfA [Planctomycetota bacterium]|nr:30S ribosome-binding factor RbfA [Planctomycetota bacterium]
MSNNRMGRVAKELQREISQIILYELSDPRLGFITVTRTEPSPDLLCSKVFVTILGNEDARKTSIALLNNAANHIHRLLLKRIKMRYVPRLSFHFDETIEEELKVYKLLDQISCETASKEKKPKKLPARKPRLNL